MHGVKSFVKNKHWGCEGALIMDVRIKPHHAPPLVEDPSVAKSADRFFQKGASLEKYE